MPIPVQKEQLQAGPGVPAGHAPKPADPLSGQPQAPQEGQPNANPAANKDNHGYIELKKVIQDLLAIEKNPHGRGVTVSTQSKDGKHTFTVTVQEPDMVMQAREKGGPVGEAGPSDGGGMAMASSSKGIIRLANADDASMRKVRSSYPESFLKSMGI